VEEVQEVATRKGGNETIVSDTHKKGCLKKYGFAFQGGDDGHKFTQPTEKFGKERKKRKKIYIQ